MRSGKIHSFIIFVFSLLIVACNNNKETREATTTDSIAVPARGKIIFDRLVGNWQNTDGKSFERWIKNADGSFNAAAYSIRGSDTVWSERASIYKVNSNWIFENLVTGQNEGKAVKFTSTLLSDTSVQFSNPAHDFPTDINYSVTSDTTVHAFIIGPNQKGGKDTIPFDFRKIF